MDEMPKRTKKVLLVVIIITVACLVVCSFALPPLYVCSGYFLWSFCQPIVFHLIRVKVTFMLIRVQVSGWRLSHSFPNKTFIFFLITFFLIEDKWSNRIAAVHADSTHFARSHCRRNPCVYLLLLKTQPPTVQNSEKELVVMDGPIEGATEWIKGTPSLFVPSAAKKNIL